MDGLVLGFGFGVFVGIAITLIGLAFVSGLRAEHEICQQIEQQDEQR